MQSATATALVVTVPPGRDDGADYGHDFPRNRDELPALYGDGATAGRVSFTPVQGRFGSFVTVSGMNFDSNPTNNQVTIGGAAAPVQSATATQLVVKVPAGATTGPIVVTTPVGSAQSAMPFTVTTIAALAIAPAQATLPQGSSLAFRATATFADQTTLDVTSFTAWSSSNPGSVSISAAGLAQGIALGTATITGTLGALSGSGAVQVTADSGTGPLPPDPATVATPINRTVATPFATSTAFLYSGANPIQTGVDCPARSSARAAVLRGQVETRDGWPLARRDRDVLDHPEFGRRSARADGMFDLAVNGGGPLDGELQGGLSDGAAARGVPWQDYIRVSRVVMVPAIPGVSGYAWPRIGAGRARNAATDANGTRRATPSSCRAPPRRWSFPTAVRSRSPA